ncbi:winged helix-turn-helix domain-containing protein [Halosolutus halophilus]|uniref:winged helix-turn-helix domain-containing protein n=1 Tax=Halosolutus halophilus TaxID=1552990 RepID=UPI002234FFAB|nr:helix-turn-helix domain-containing protein [Halosolutus halophilus]
MKRSPTKQPGWPTDDDLDAQAVLSALDDDGCRAILEATTGEALTATELAEQCDIPTSTAYRKVEKLADADLVEERVRINTSGKHATEYHRCFDDVVVSVGDTGGVEIELTQPDTGSDSESMPAVAGD